MNFVGKKCVSFAIKEKLIEEKNIMKINGVPHIQVYFIDGGK
jgi:hypothetical protein